MPNALRRILTIALVLALAWALQPASAADVKLTLWRLKTYIPPADKILDTNAQECAKKMGAELQIQTYTFDDMWTKWLVPGVIPFSTEFAKDQPPSS